MLSLFFQIQPDIHQNVAYQNKTVKTTSIVFSILIMSQGVNVLLAMLEKIPIPKHAFQVSFYLIKVPIFLVPVSQVLTLILPRQQKWFAFAASMEPGQPAHLYSLTRLYTVGLDQLQSPHLDIMYLKNDNEQFKKCKVDYSV